MLIVLLFRILMLVGTLLEVIATPPHPSTMVMSQTVTEPAVLERLPWQRTITSVEWEWLTSPALDVCTIFVSVGTVQLWSN